MTLPLVATGGARTTAAARSSAGRSWCLSAPLMIPTPGKCAWGPQHGHHCESDGGYFLGPDNIPGESESRAHDERRVRLHCHFVRRLIQFTTEPLTYLAPLFLR
jgi:hypothetical protein